MSTVISPEQAQATQSAMQAALAALDPDQIGGKFCLAGPPPDALRYARNTLVGIICDESPSVSGFRDALAGAVGNSVEACKSSDCQDSLLVRVTAFNENVREIHPLKLIGQLNPNDYKGSIRPSGYGTAAIDAVLDTLAVFEDYAKALQAQGYATNAIIFLITDGETNAGKNQDEAAIQARVAEVLKTECLESVNIVLIGVTKDKKLRGALAAFADACKFDQYVMIDDTDEDTSGRKTLAHLAGFVSKSVSLTSSQVGTGTKSAPVTI